MTVEHKVEASLRIATAVLSCLILGCAQPGLRGTQDHAPIESRTLGRGAVQDNVTETKVPATVQNIENVDPVVNISPLEDDGVGPLVPITAQDGAVSTLGKNIASPRPNAATQQLLSDAQAAFVQGDLVAAESVTNRGLRIAPKDPALWLQLAKIRLGQGEYLEAISLSERAQVLAVDNLAAKIDALEIIATAHESRGDLDKASEAREKLRELSGELGTH